MSIVTRPSNMAVAFVNAAVPHLRRHGPKSIWMARRVADNADREVGTLKEINNIDISGRSGKEIDKSLRNMGFNF